MDISFTEGNDYSHTATAVDDATGVAIDLTGATINFRVFARETLHVGAQTPIASFSKDVGSGITLVTPASGIFRIDFDDTDSVDKAGEYEFEIEFTLSDAKIYSAQGGFYVAPRRRLDQ